MFWSTFRWPVVREVQDPPSSLYGFFPSENELAVTLRWQQLACFYALWYIYFSVYTAYIPRWIGVNALRYAIWYEVHVQMLSWIPFNVPRNQERALRENRNLCNHPQANRSAWSWFRTPRTNTVVLFMLAASQSVVVSIKWWSSERSELALMQPFNVRMCLLNLQLHRHLNEPCRSRALKDLQSS